MLCLLLVLQPRGGPGHSSLSFLLVPLTVPGWILLITWHLSLPGAWPLCPAGCIGSSCGSPCPELAWSFASPRDPGTITPPPTPHPHCLPLGTHGFQAEGREGASISWTRRQPGGTVRQAGVCRPQDLRLNTGPRRQEGGFLVRKFQEVGACRITMLAASSGHTPSPSSPGWGPQCFLDPGSLRASHPFVSRMHCKERAPPLSLSSPGCLGLEETVSLGI